MSVRTIAASLAGKTDFDNTVPEWEIELLEDQVATFERFHE